MSGAAAAAAAAATGSATSPPNEKDESSPAPLRPKDSSGKAAAAGIPAQGRDLYDVHKIDWCLDPSSPCHEKKSADFVPFDCFFWTPYHCGRHISVTPQAATAAQATTRAVSGGAHGAKKKKPSKESEPVGNASCQQGQGEGENNNNEDEEGNVEDRHKLVPDGNDFKLVFISSDSSKESGKCSDRHREWSLTSAVSLSFGYSYLFWHAVKMWDLSLPSGQSINGVRKNFGFLEPPSLSPHLALI